MAALTQRFSRYALAAALSAVCTGAVAEESLTVISFGGAYGAAHKQHMVDPFIKDTGTKILMDSYSGGIAEMKAQVESGRITWDVVSIEAIDLERACSEGLLEVIDHSKLPAGIDGKPAAEDFFPEALASECAVATDIFSVVFAYNKNTIGSAVPQSVADVFDLNKIPGKRAFQKRPQVALEWALMADGVAKDKVYEVLATDEGQARAFAKLDTIKKDIVWFDSWSQAPQLLNDGGAVIVQSANGRFYDAIRRENKPFVIVWDGHLYDMDVWSVMKGTPKKDLAMKFVSYSTESKPLAGMADVAYGPTRKSSMPLLEKDVVANLPTSHLDVGLNANSEFWADYGETLGEKFNEWLLKK
ncbi:ABC transporter substrate-binding protein [Pseudomonas sp. TTU2014-080ASC]|uniref:ABC transporter substrate-binding protein n=1 Tax=Pseudomonas sp. TTU2014-080ASC TaxID=1729724 RepID=UPI0007189D57|nr:ABC transporter substrate-binding protein [Pseudomonas sp. TTU2014-080ASC]KRW61505.1 spermidine/putrescine ABC transporter substrate-binding protein [Pseudomonas sp. TTU2014-080ASC]